ncbi:MAG: hypothetical protein ABIR11_07050, partial [Candidatus Limnocylindrales bacterium]
LPPVYGTMGGMEKTTVYLTSTQKAALARTAAEEDRSEATLIRAGVDVVTARHRSGEAPTAPIVSGHLDGGDQAADVPGRPRWLGRDAFVREILRHPADAALRDELRELAPDTTDEIVLP